MAGPMGCVSTRVCPNIFCFTGGTEVHARLVCTSRADQSVSHARATIQQYATAPSLRRRRVCDGAVCGVCRKAPLRKHVLCARWGV